MILQLRNQHYNISTIFLLYVVAIYFSNLTILSFNSHLPIESIIMLCAVIVQWSCAVIILLFMFAVF